MFSLGLLFRLRPAKGIVEACRRSVVTTGAGLVVEMFRQLQYYCCHNAYLVDGGRCSVCCDDVFTTPAITCVCSSSHPSRMISSNSKAQTAWFACTSARRPPPLAVIVQGSRGSIWLDLASSACETTLSDKFAVLWFPVKRDYDWTSPEPCRITSTRSLRTPVASATVFLLFVCDHPRLQQLVDGERLKQKCGYLRCNRNGRRAKALACARKNTEMGHDYVLVYETLAQGMGSFWS